MKIVYRKQLMRSKVRIIYRYSRLRLNGAHAPFKRTILFVPAIFSNKPTVSFIRSHYLSELGLQNYKYIISLAIENGRKQINLV